MNLKRNPASNWKLCCIIDSNAIGKRDPVKFAEKLFKNGAEAVQLRYKNAPSYELVPIAKKISGLAKKYGKAFLVNDRIDVALAAGASGVHLGTGDISFEAARSLLGAKKVVGKTVHSIRQARRLSREKINYMSAGHIFQTPHKKGIKGRGLGFLKKVKNAAKIQLFAIGGINRQNVKGVIEAGADGVCVVRRASDAKNLLKEINDAK